MTRVGDVYLDLQKRCDIANKNKCDYFISIHCNSATSIFAEGTEIFVYQRGTKAERIAEVAQRSIVSYSKNNDRGVKTANFYVLKNTNMPAVLLEMMFLSNPKEEQILNDISWQNGVTKALAKDIGRFLGIIKTPFIEPVLKKTPIMGNSIAKESQMTQFVQKVNRNAPNLAAFYLEIGKKEGVRGDLAFAQAIKETGYFRFRGDVKREQNNFAGIGAVGGGDRGVAFSSEEEGILAQIQHLKAYASTQPLNTEKVDPRFDLVQRGSAPNWEDLNGKWAIPGENYGESIVSIWKQILNEEIKQEHYAKEEYEKWRKTGILNNDHDLDDFITWGQYIITQERLRNKE